MPALLLLCVVGVIATQRAVPTSLRSDPKPPTWPDSYSVEYVFSLPYTKKIQPDGIRHARLGRGGNAGRAACHVHCAWM